MNHTTDDSLPIESLEKILEVARLAASEAGAVLMKYLREGVQMRSKEGENSVSYDLVSDADLEAEKTVERILSSRFPDHALLGEETLDGPTDAEHLWIIDPLDGTNNFAHRIPHFAVSIAYWYRGKPQVGLVYNPAHQDTYHAIRGHGAFHNGTRVYVSNEDSLNQAMIGCGFYYDRGAMMRATLSAVEELFYQHIHGIRRFGTAAIDLCYVGCGHFGAFFEYQLSPWDFAAGALFVEEAGGRITTLEGNALPLEKTPVVAGNPILHEKVREIAIKHYLAVKNTSS
jgi:myo-inositol-1(or 4)-monophosphatase